MKHPLWQLFEATGETERSEDSPKYYHTYRRKNTNDYEDVRVPRLGGRVTAFLLHSPIPWLTASIIILSSCLLPATIVYLPYLSIHLFPSLSLIQDYVNTTYRNPTTSQREPPCPSCPRKSDTWLSPPPLLSLPSSVHFPGKLQ